jgi:hypothetical protein
MVVSASAAAAAFLVFAFVVVMVHVVLVLRDFSVQVKFRFALKHFLAAWRTEKVCFAFVDCLVLRSFLVYIHVAN